MKVNFLGAAGALALLVWRLLPDHAEAAGASFSGLGVLLQDRRVLRLLGVTLLYFISAYAINRVAKLIEIWVRVPGILGAK